MAKQSERTIRRDIQALHAYSVPQAKGMVKLDAMENPYGLPFSLRRELARATSTAAINRYPDPHSRELKSILRRVLKVPARMELILGNGSDELIQLIALALARPGAVLLSLEPSFAMYPLIAAAAGLKYVGVALQHDFTLDLGKALRTIRKVKPALIFIAYPNNPTGNLFERKQIMDIIRAAPGLVVVDEAYHAFSGSSFFSQLKRWPNLLVLRTLSKQGLAGLRLGCLVGHPDWLRHLEKLRLPYNISVLTQIAAARILRHADILDAQTCLIRRERSELLRKLNALHAVEAFSSEANFILFRVARAKRVFEKLKRQNVLIKLLHGQHALLRNCLRVTVGTPRENACFISALRRSLAVR